MTDSTPKAITQRTCFVICPIGANQSEERRRADWLLLHIITPVLEPRGYQLLRADLLPTPGMITYQIVEHLQNDSLVVADLTGRNPNVFYEIGIRHTVGKPIIHMHAAGEVLPFDVQAFRSIPYDLQWPQDIVEAKQHLEKQVLETEQQGYVSRSPVQMFTDIISAGSTKPSDEKILRELADLALRIRSLEDQSRRHASPKALAAALLDRPEHSLSTSDSNAIIDILSKVPVRPLRISDSAMDEFLEFQRKRDSDPID